MKLDSPGGPESMVLEDTDPICITFFFTPKPVLEQHLTVSLGVQGFKDTKLRRDENRDLTHALKTTPSMGWG